MEPPRLEKQELSDWVTLQALVLLIISFGWLQLAPLEPAEAALGLHFGWQARDTWFLLGGSLLLIACSGLLYRWVPPLRAAVDYVFTHLLTRLGPWHCFYLALLSAVSEEIFFRGVLQAKWGWLAAGLCFGLLHIPAPQHWHYALWASGVGLFLGQLYLWSGSLWVVIGIHFFNNWLALLCWPWLKQRLPASPPAAE